MAVTRFFWPAINATPATYYICDTEAELPASATEGDQAWAKNTDSLFIWDGAAWVKPPAGTGSAPSSADYLVGTANASLSAEIVVGTSPGGELGGTWGSPTVDATHSGSSHTGVIATHEAAADPHTGYLKESNTIDFLVGTATGELAGEIVVGATPGGELGGTWASPTVDATHSGTSHAGVVTTHEAAADPHTGYLKESLVDAKGDIIAASAADTPARLAVGTNSQVLLADSGASTGLAWATRRYIYDDGHLALTNASVGATGSFEDWGSGGASTITITNPGIAIRVLAWLQGYASNSTATNEIASTRVTISFDNGSTWDAGSDVEANISTSIGQRAPQNCQHRKSGTPTADVLIKPEIRQSSGSAGDTTFANGMLMYEVIAG